MNKWQILFHPKALAEFNDLPLDISARFSRIFALVDQFGLNALQMPYARPLQGKIWEMRASGREGIARSLYVVASGMKIKILVCFVKKTQKAPQDKIHLAQRRLKDLEE